MVERRQSLVILDIGEGRSFSACDAHLDLDVDRGDSDGFLRAEGLRQQVVKILGCGFVFADEEERDLVGPRLVVRLDFTQIARMPSWTGPSPNFDSSRFSNGSVTISFMRVTSLTGFRWNRKRKVRLSVVEGGSIRNGCVRLLCTGSCRSAAWNPEFMNWLSGSATSGPFIDFRDLKMDKRL
ncbi:hypothetical protein [Tianweitania sediminis]|uniref:Uncharacterized protein n=1 Tax=Tianweitania sediminis TaxID=1502156 RepID=A0A8J7UIT6_9HYPH|nr:hypothetical protein [Tianweitania sediminis]MBP0437984.1 hypothetical protein [Tianweitania sediminis]